MSQSFPTLDVDVPEWTPEELKRRLDADEEVTLLDTRRPADFEEWQIDHPNLTTVNVPFLEFLDETGEQPAESIPDDVPEGPVVTSCGKGISSEYVAAFLREHGREAYALADGMEGWARLYEQASMTAADRTVIQLHRPSSGCLAYLFVAGEKAAVVDPLRAFAGEYADIAAEYGATLEYAIDTHVHADHVSGVRESAAATGAEMVLPAGARERGLSFDATLVSDRDRLPLGDTEIVVEALPGHTTEMTGYRFGGVLATGDSLFLQSVARPDLEDEDRARDAAGQLWETLQDLADERADLVVAPGHAESGTKRSEAGSFTETLGTLRERLAAFEQSKEEFVENAVTNLPPRPKNFEEIIDINLGRATTNDDEAFELELGPNNCAVEA